MALPKGVFHFSPYLQPSRSGGIGTPPQKFILLAVLKTNTKTYDQDASLESR